METADDLVVAIHRFRRRHRVPPTLIAVHPREATRFAAMLDATDYHDLVLEANATVPPGTLVIVGDVDDDDLLGALS